MNTASQNPKILGMTRKQAAVISGLGLLVMAVLAPIASFGILTPMVVEGDSAATAANILAGKGFYILGIICLFVVVILDVVVAMGLLVFLKPVHAALSQVQAWLRVIYGGIFLYAQVKLLIVLQILESSPEQVLDLINSFTAIWDKGLIIFALHLIVLGIVIIQAGYMKKILGILVLIAGAGYLADGIIRLAMPESQLTVSVFTFIGEVVLLFWLLIRGRKVAEESN